MDLYIRVREKKAGLCDEMLSKFPEPFVQGPCYQWKDLKKERKSQASSTPGHVEETESKFFFRSLKEKKLEMYE